MDTSSHGEHHQDSTVDRASATTPPGPSEDAVAVAEGIVGDSWIRVLIGYRDQKQVAAHAAFVCCVSARQSLAEALIGRVPRAIAAAQAELETALAAEHATGRTFEQAQQGLELELTRLTWRAMEGRVAACMASNGQSHTQLALADAERRSEPATTPRLTLAGRIRLLVPRLLGLAGSLFAGERSS